MNPFGLTPQQISKYVVSIQAAGASMPTKKKASNRQRSSYRIKPPLEKRKSLRKVVREFLQSDANQTTQQLFEKARSSFAQDNPRWLTHAIGFYRAEFLRTLPR